MPSTRMPSVPCPTCSPARTVGRAAQAPFLVRRFGMVYSWAPFRRTVLFHRGQLRFWNFFPSHHWFWSQPGQPRLQLVMEDTANHLFSVVPAAQKVMICCPGTQHQPWGLHHLDLSLMLARGINPYNHYLGDGHGS